MNGLSMWWSVGKFAGFHIQVTTKYPAMLRIVIGWFAIAIILIDMDRVIGYLLHDYKNNSKKENI